MSGGLGSGRIRSSIAVRQTTHPALDQAGHSLCRATDGPHYRDLRRRRQNQGSLIVSSTGPMRASAGGVGVILQPHVQSTMERVHGHPVVPCIRCTTEPTLNEQNIVGLGPLSHEAQLVVHVSSKSRCTALGQTLHIWLVVSALRFCCIWSINIMYGCVLKLLMESGNRSYTC